MPPTDMSPSTGGGGGGDEDVSDTESIDLMDAFVPSHVWIAEYEEKCVPAPRACPPPIHPSFFRFRSRSLSLSPLSL